jgi:hypothetical protein
MVVVTGSNRSRRRYEQSEPTEPRPATRRPGQAGPTTGRRRPAEARPAAAGARKGRSGRSGRSGRTAPGRTRAKPLNDLRQFGPGFGRGSFAVSWPPMLGEEVTDRKSHRIEYVGQRRCEPDIGPRPAPLRQQGIETALPGDITPLTSPMMFHDVARQIFRLE